MNSSLILKARNYSLFRAFLFLPVICALNAFAQEVPASPAAEPGATISVDVRLVVLHVSVRTNNGRIVSGLQADNFRIEEDGQPQAIKEFRPEDIPVAVGLVVDNSGSMRKKRSAVTSAAMAFARASNPDDEMFIVNFNDRVTFGLPDTQLFSASPTDLEDALLKSIPSGRTTLYDATAAALTHLQKSTRERKALVVISDGADNRSQSTLAQLLKNIGRSDATIYTIGLYDEDDSDQNPGALRRIASASGGETFLPGSLAEAVKICEHIARDIRAQYTISYSPSDQKFAGEYREIQAAAFGSHGQKLKVRTRAGYIADPAPSASGVRQ